MNKKLLFAAMSLVAFTACTNDDLESQKQNAAEKASPVQFEVVNDALSTRASMNGNTIVWNANDGDLFTLYHGAAALEDVNGYQNATYKANANPGGNAYLTTPSMILDGAAIMVWPVDTTFRIGSGDDLSLVIPEEIEDIENNIPYVSDQFFIDAWAEYDKNDPATIYNVAGKDRKYPVYMRPMASQLTVKADYAGTDSKLKELEAGEDGIDPIRVTSADILTDAGGATAFTTEIGLKFSAAPNAVWADPALAPEYNAWERITLFNAAIDHTGKLSTKVADNESSKFLLLPQADIATVAGEVVDGAVVINTIYGKVVIASNNAQGSEYTAAEAKDAWCRYIKEATAPEAYEEKATDAETSGDNAGKYKTTSAIEKGMMQTIDVLSAYTAGDGVIAGEPMGAAVTRYVKVLLNHLDMSDLHIKTDKQLRDAARVWKHMGLSDVTVYLDGDEDGEFEISQKTIETINEINSTALGFTVKPCNLAGEECETIVITGGGDVQDMAFIVVGDGGNQAKVAFDEGETWKWKGTVKVDAAGVYRIYNWGTMVNDEAGEFTLKTAEYDGTQNDVMLVNQGTWNVTAGTIFVQFDVTNRKEMNISKGAELREDGGGHIFRNWAAAKPTRFGGDDDEIGTIENKGVFAVVNNGKIYNHGLIEHADVDAKTYVTTNQLGGNFGAAFSSTNKMGRINLPYSNKDEDNISVSSTLDQGFISVTVDGEVSGALKADVLGNKVNYVIIKSGVTEIQKVAGTVKYLEINEPGTEIAWKVTETSNYDGLMVLSKVNITQGTNVTVNQATYLGATMYVGGVFAWGSWSGYYGDTSDAFATKYVTYF